MQPAVIDPEFARDFAAEWVAAWNSHDLDRILAHYSEDFAMESPFIVTIMNEPSGVLHGKAAVRAYWTRGLASTPPIRFELIDVYAGVGAITIHYRSVARGLVTETLSFDHARHQVVRGAAHYGPPDRG